MIVVTARTGLVVHQVLENLLDRDEPVRVIARDPNRLAAGVRERVEVVQGSHTDRDVVDKTFDCADSVFWLVPPDPQAARVEAAYVDLSRPARETLTISPRGRCSRSLTGLRIDSCSVKHVSDAYQDQDVLTDENGRRRADGEEELCLVSGRDEEAKRGVDYRQDAGELGFAKEERNQPGKWKQQSDSDEEGGEHPGPQFMYASLDSQWSQQEAENKAQPKQDCQYSLCSAERRNCLG